MRFSKKKKTPSVYQTFSSKKDEIFSHRFEKQTRVN